MKNLAIAVMLGYAAMIAVGCGKPLQASNGDAAVPPTNGDAAVPPTTPFEVTFDLRNDGTVPVYVYQGCLLELTLTAVADPTRAFGRYEGCGVCDCAQATCPAVVCGACFAGALEIAARSSISYAWSAVDVTYEAPTAGAAGQPCSHTRVLPAGSYRIEVATYATAGDAAARTSPRLVSQTFELPAPSVVAVPLAAP